MEILAFVLAVVALLWLYSNRNVLSELEKKQLLLQKESARLNSRLEKLVLELEKLRESFSKVETAQPAQPAQPAPAGPERERAKRPEPPVVVPPLYRLAKRRLVHQLSAVRSRHQ